MSRIFIRDVLSYDGRKKDILIEEGVFSNITDGNAMKIEADRIIDGRDLIAMPGLCNTHTHAAMTLLRGVGDDLELDRWLQEKIWPLEFKMRFEHIKAGFELACLEMIKTGTTMFNDMYFHEDKCVPIVERMGLRAVLGEGFMDCFGDDMTEKNKKATGALLRASSECESGSVSASIAPHSVYTVSEDGLRWCREMAEKHGCTIHIHISETEKEVEDCIRDHGATPVRYLDDIGLLGPDVIGAHCVHLLGDDIRLMKDKDVKVSHNPISNMKLAVGGHLPIMSLLENKMAVTLGTDGAASNNTLDMFQTMKFASLLARDRYGASSIKTREVFDMATRSGYLALGVDGGIIEEGKVADLILLDRGHHSMVPGNDPLSDIVYSCSSAAVKYSIIGGEMVMEEGVVKGEKDILKNGRKMALDLMENDL